MSGNKSIVGISGSLRGSSYNTALIRAAAELAPSGMTITLADLSEIPLYNQDTADAAVPSTVVTLSQTIQEADGVLISTPEYNYSIPGVLKNAIDWLSRQKPQPFDGKPLAIMGASMGRLGTARAQYHLRQVFVFMNATVLNKPEVMVGGAHDLIDDGGKLTDENTRKHVAGMLEGFGGFIDRWRAGA